MNPGRYFFGDPCYCFSNEPDHGTWDKLLNDTNYFERNSDKWPGLVVGSTTFGDGTYNDNFGKRYCVDAGIIGLTHEHYWETSEEYLNQLGQIIEIKEDFEFYANGGEFILTLEDKQIIIKT